MNSDTLILRSTTNPPLTNKNDYLTPTDFDGNFIKIYDDLLSLCVTTGVIAYNASTTYDDEVVQYATYGGRLWSWVNASPGSAITPGTNALYWAEIFPTQLAHRMNSDTILSEGTADEVTAAEIRAFIDGGLTTTTNLAVTEQTNNSLKITSSTGTDAVLTEATLSLAGLFSADDKARLINTNGVNTGDQTIDSLGAEAVVNKATDFTTINDTLYPSVAAVSAEITSQIATATTGFTGDNFANTDLTFTAYRTHDLGGFGAILTDGLFNIQEGSIGVSKTTTSGGVAGFVNDDITASTIYTRNDSAGGVALLVEGFLQLDGLPIYANEAAAVTGGLATNVVYKTSTGELRIKL